jgi:hypothetical protein
VRGEVELSERAMRKRFPILPSLLAISLAAPAAKPAEYSCSLPRALLCEGCARELEVAIQPGGACRVSFVTPPGLAPAGPAGNIELRVRVAPMLAGGPVRLFRPRRTVAARLGAAGPRCFVFNGSRYCE